MTPSDETTEPQDRRTGPLAARGEPRAEVALGLLAVFLVAAVLLYRPAFGGPFVSDDTHWVSHNPYVQGLSAENLLLIARPLGEASFAVGNYSPLPLLIHAAQYRIFGEEVAGYHAVSACLHALAAALLVGVLLRSGVPRAAALAGGAFFLLHPANVEAVAWISQLRTVLAMVLGLSAVLLFSRRPALATLCFSLALLAKPSAFVALPFLLVLGWAGAHPPRRIWLAIWLAVLALYAIPELRLQQTMGVVAPAESDLGVRARSIVAFAARYLVMAATAFGASTYHQPELPRSWLDPWCLAGLGLLALLGWRTIWALRRRQEEAAWWLWAALSFAPISQVFPFTYPMADRYLYFVLPGLIGGAILAGRSPARHLIARWSSLGKPLSWGAGAVALVLLATFALRSHDRAAIWASSTAIFLDGATRYPDGIDGSILRALRALGAGDREEAIRALETAHARGFRVFESLLQDPALNPLRGDPRYEALIVEIAAERIESRRAKPNASLFDMLALTEAHLVLGQIDEAIGVLDRVAALRGSEHRIHRERIERMRAYAEQERERRAREAGGPSGETRR